MGLGVAIPVPAPSLAREVPFILHFCHRYPPRPFVPGSSVNCQGGLHRHRVVIVTDRVSIHSFGYCLSSIAAIHLRCVSPALSARRTIGNEHAVATGPSSLRLRRIFSASVDLTLGGWDFSPADQTRTKAHSPLPICTAPIHLEPARLSRPSVFFPHLKTPEAGLSRLGRLQARKTRATCSLSARWSHSHSTIGIPVDFNNAVEAGRTTVEATAGLVNPSFRPT